MVGITRSKVISVYVFFLGRRLFLRVLLDPSGSLILKFLTKEESENESGSHENDGLGTSSSDEEEDQEEHQAQSGQHTLPLDAF